MSNPTNDFHNDDDDDDEFSIADLGLAEYKPVVERPPRKFEPWHRPRKQFVRKSQWAACLADIYTGRDPTKSVNYLGLPGTDLLDLRVFYETICAPQNRTLRFLGFNHGVAPGSAEAVSLDVSLQEVKLRELVDEGSKILNDDINRIGSGDSMAFQEARRAAPYDVINLDFTVGVARDAPKGIDSIYNTLNRIMAMQQRLDPWILFVTGQIARDAFNPEAARTLHSLFLDALKCDGFPEACAAYFETDDLTSLDITSCSENDYFYSMAIGFCLWIFRLAQTGNAKKVSLRAAFYYQIKPDASHPDMVSMAIRFKPVIVAAPDPSGLAIGSSNRVNQCEASVQFASKLTNAVDVDQRLENNSGLRDELIEESSQLLLEVGYKVEDYRQWVAQFHS